LSDRLPWHAADDAEQFAGELQRARIFHARRFRSAVNDFAVRLRRRQSLRSFQSSGSSPPRAAAGDDSDMDAQ
jgi:hypothetical protein